jgi:hypothetical protein
MKQLPIGISTFQEIRKNNYVYIDKTRHVANLATRGKYYFLSRPRRFGKSLLIDTLKQAFLGRKELFSGLYLENVWDWSKQYPVIHFSFGGSSALSGSVTLLDTIWQILKNSSLEYQVELCGNLSYGQAFQQLIRDIVTKHKQPLVILVDEYDKPILDNLTNQPQAIEMREMLKDLYSIIKENDAYLKFVLLTGVSKFSKVSLFSGLNILDDITLDQEYADICGYNQNEMEREFDEYLTHGKVDKTQLKLWYNGYNFAGSETQKVYNPFDILLFFSKDYQYRNYWFETATPTFLVRLIEQKHYFIPDLEKIVVNEDVLSSFDIEQIPLITLLFQTGYLTIKEQVMRGKRIAYCLSYPNWEVKFSLNERLAEIGSSVEKRSDKQEQLYQALENSDFIKAAEVLSSHFASIPHDWYRNNDIANYEGFYASIVYSLVCALGYEVIAEDVTNHGKIDLTVKMEDKIIILEFKLSKYGSATEAISQIKERNYAEKYLSEAKTIYLLGISFDSDKRNIEDVQVEEV